MEEIYRQGTGEEGHKGFALQHFHEFTNLEILHTCIVGIFMEASSIGMTNY